MGQSSQAGIHGPKVSWRLLEQIAAPSVYVVVVANVVVSMVVVVAALVPVLAIGLSTGFACSLLLVNAKVRYGGVSGQYWCPLSHVSDSPAPTPLLFHPCPLHGVHSPVPQRFRDICLDECCFVPLCRPAAFATSLGEHIAEVRIMLQTAQQAVIVAAKTASGMRKGRRRGPAVFCGAAGPDASMHEALGQVFRYPNLEGDDDDDGAAGGGGCGDIGDTSSDLGLGGASTSRSGGGGAASSEPGMCGDCDASVAGATDGLMCGRCSRWYHLGCLGLSEAPPWGFTCAKCLFF